VVIQTTGIDGHSTKALATLPGIADSQGIYRPIDPTTFYTTRADVRVDQFGDTDPSGALEDPNNPGFLICGCPVQSINLLDWPMQVSFASLDGHTDPTHAPAVGVAASSQTHTWHLFGFTADIAADIDLNVPVVEGQWYGVETDFNATTSALHGTITDASGQTLADKTVKLNVSQFEIFGKYNPNVDGAFNAEAYIDSELTLVHGTDPTLTKPGLAVIDNIDTTSKGQGGSSSTGNPNTFHWNPAAAGLDGKSFTADTMDLIGNLTDVPQPDGTHLVDRIEQIKGFSLNGHTVTPTGFDTNYGLYFEAVDHNTGDFPPRFISVQWELKADPGNHNGQVISDPSGTGFTNTGPTGQADDIVLAHGSLNEALLFIDGTTTPPTLNGDNLLNFIPDVADFFKGGSDLLHNVASNPVTFLEMTDVPGVGTVINFHDFVSHSQFVTDRPGNGNAFAFGPGNV
jgi:hypothetical protein